MKWFELNINGQIIRKSIIKESEPKGCLIYFNPEIDYERAYKELKNTYPNLPVIGVSSFKGVFTPEGFKEGGAGLFFENKDGIDLYPILGNKKTKEEGAKAAKTLKDKMKKENKIILMHATPEEEEKVLEGIKEIFGDEIAIYGGSAADNDLTGKWKIFLNSEKNNEGFLLIGISSLNKIYGEFLSGYLPTKNKGRITKAKGRIIYEIDGHKAAEVYNDWTEGSIKDYLDAGGVILSITTFNPLGRIVGKIAGIDLYNLSHPHEVLPKEKAISFFTEFHEGEEVILMQGTKKGLITRTSQVASWALGADKDKEKIKGSILIYCAGCVGAVYDQRNEIINEYKNIIGEIPFIGAATFGEQGSFKIKKDKNKHGNLMCSTIIFS